MSMTTPLFSIITISFNSSKTIERTIKSVLSQTFDNYEYIIVDGASKDGTLDIVKKYEPLFEGRMKWKSEPDSGIYDAMNKGIRMATGDIIGIVNSDDWLEPDALSLVADAFNINKNTNTLYCGGIKFHSDYKEVREMGVNLSSFRRWAPFYIMSGIRHPATFVPRDVYNTIGLFNDKMKLSADQEFILRCYYGGVNFYAVNHCLSNMASGGISTNHTKQSFEASKHDRRIMLSAFGFKGVKYYWLYYSWRVRGFAAMLLKKMYNVFLGSHIRKLER